MLDPSPSSSECNGEIRVRERYKVDRVNEDLEVRGSGEDQVLMRSVGDREDRQESREESKNTTKESSDYVENLDSEKEVTGFVNQKKEQDEVYLEEKSEVFVKRRRQDVNASVSEYFRTKTPVNESKGELLEEFITPEINSESMLRNDHGNPNLLHYSRSWILPKINRYSHRTKRRSRIPYRHVRY